MQPSSLTRHPLRRALAVLAAGALAAALAVPAQAAPHHRGHGKHPDARAEAPVVRVSDGKVRGTQEASYQTFEGIPFAAPPVGDLRFRAPQRVRPWKGVLDATAPRQQCAQLASGTGNPTSTDEDCLYLNVTTPTTNKRHGKKAQGKRHAKKAHGKKKPVMVWIHGGAFVSGFGGSYDASKLAVDGDVVVVTINYRLGPLGFLAHSDLSAESPRLGSGNAGILDQQAALRWVKRNIKAFGGDPRNVTVFGESAGSASVCANIASPLARGLFHRAIAQSYACTGSFHRVEEAEASGDDVAAEVGCAEADDVAACLREVDAESLLQAWDGGDPVVGGGVLPKQPGAAWKDGSANRVDLMHGNTLDENRLFIPLEYGTTLTGTQYAGAIHGIFGPLAQTVLGLYPVDAYPTPTIALSTVFSDYGTPLSTCSHIDAYETTSQRRGTKVYAYQFQDRTADPLIPLLDGQDGASHATELPFLFPGLFGDGLSAEQEQLSDAMVAYWTSFAATGHPYGKGLPRWPSYAGTDDVLALDLPAAGGVQTEDVAGASNCGFWSQLG